MRLLIIDDDLDERRRISEAFTAAGWSIVAHARDAEEAVQLITHHQPDAAVVDPVLPGATAEGLLARLRTAAPQAMLLVFATPSERHFIQACHLAGADAYVLKGDRPTGLVLRSERLRGTKHRIPPATPASVTPTRP